METAEEPPMETFRPDNIRQSACGHAAPYDPPKVEMVVTAADLGRETLYGGGAPYGDL